LSLVTTQDACRIGRAAVTLGRHETSVIVEPGELVLIAAYRWDVVGAPAAGLQAVWMDRLEKRRPFPLDESPRAAGSVEAAQLALAGIA
jgi:hypothetical protein